MLLEALHDSRNTTHLLIELDSWVKLGTRQADRSKDVVTLFGKLLGGNPVMSGHHVPIRTRERNGSRTRDERHRLILKATLRST